jgi:UDP-N-acetylglucosamine diphosphorylase / glucose-1-phosphate thymidylyltransferase / UDP-N-acetylgalactosamine diphosphorylase / glucosamine-1-phosphate N-acetyltransferase / galactosamine-1-phosphate N-acetyltransferase
MKALMLAAGPATRLHPFTKTRPKPLLPLANETILHRNLRELHDAGVQSVVIVHAQGDTRIMEAVGSGTKLGLHIEYVEQVGEGIGAAITSAREKFVFGQYFLLGYGDIMSTENIYSNILSVFNRLRAPVASVCLTDESTRFYGNVYLDGEMKITSIVEKPKSADLGNYILGGVYMVPYQIFDILDQTGGDMHAALERLIDKEGLYAAVWEDDWIDINYPWSILHANRLVMDRLTESRIAADVVISNSVTINGPVVIEKGVTIREGVVIRGPAVIGANCFIGNNALVREYCSLGPGSQVGFGTELKNCVIFGNAIIGRISYVGDSVVGEGAHIGSGTMTINYPIEEEEVLVPVQGRLRNTRLRKLGAFIGDGAMVGASNTIQAGTVVDAGAIIPDHFSVDRKEG